MLRGGMFGAAAGFVLGLMVRLPLLTVLGFLVLGLVTSELLKGPSDAVDWGVVACVLGCQALLILGIVMIPYEWFRGRPLPAKPLAWMARGMALLWGVCILMIWVKLADRMDGGHAILFLWITFSMVLLGRLWMKESEEMQAEEDGETGSAGELGEGTKGTCEALPEDADPRQDKMADL